MRILQVIDQLNVGGAERVLVDISNILHARGHSIEVLTLVQAGKLSAQLHTGIPIINLNRRTKLNIRLLYRCHRICSNYDVIHVHLRYNFRYVALARWLFGGEYRILLHDHFGDIEKDKNIPFGLSFFLKRNAWFAGVSKPLAEWALQVVGVKPKNTFLLSNIIVRRQVPDIKERDQTKRLKLLHVSNFREAKHHSFAIDLIKSLKNQIAIDVHFIGQVIDPLYYAKLNEKIDLNDLSTTIQVYHDCEDVQVLMNDFDLAFHTAYQESGPLVLIEYLAQQLPFIAYKTGEVATQIQEIIPDFFMDDFNADHWIDRIKVVLKKRDSYKPQMATAFNSLYSSEAYYKKCINIYNCMLHGE
jgi:glycosyltransferase involved in cell wall biosynthesis